jgi:hypothetical protein
MYSFTMTPVPAHNRQLALRNLLNASSVNASNVNSSSDPPADLCLKASAADESKRHTISWLRRRVRELEKENKKLRQACKGSELIRSQVASLVADDSDDDSVLPK